MGKRIDAFLHLIGIEGNNGRKVVSEEVLSSGQQPDSESVSREGALDIRNLRLDDERLLYVERLSPTYRLLHYVYDFNINVELIVDGNPEKGAAIIVDDGELLGLVRLLQENPDIASKIAEDPSCQGYARTLSALIGYHPELFDTHDTITLYCWRGLHTISRAEAEGLVAHKDHSGEYSIYRKYSGRRVTTTKSNPNERLKPDHSERLAAFGMRVLTGDEYGAMRCEWRHFKDPKVNSDPALPADYRRKAISKILEPEKAAKQTTE